MPSYYSPKSICRSCIDGSINTATYQRVEHVSSGLQNQFKSSNTVFSFYNTLTPQAIELKGQGNLMKQGSGGNSYDNYMSRKKGALVQYCNCGNPL